MIRVKNITRRWVKYYRIKKNTDFYTPQMMCVRLTNKF